MSVRNAPTLRYVCDVFAQANAEQRDAHEIAIATFNAYLQICKSLIVCFGANRYFCDLLPKDSQKLRSSCAKKWGPVNLDAAMGRAHVVFRFARKGGGIIKDQVLYGGEFDNAFQEKKTIPLKKTDAKSPSMLMKCASCSMTLPSCSASTPTMETKTSARFAWGTSTSALVSSPCRVWRPPYHADA